MILEEVLCQTLLEWHNMSNIYRRIYYDMAAKGVGPG